MPTATDVKTVNVTFQFRTGGSFRSGAFSFGPTGLNLPGPSALSQNHCVAYTMWWKLSRPKSASESSLNKAPAWTPAPLTFMKGGWTTKKTPQSLVAAGQMLAAGLTNDNLGVVYVLPLLTVIWYPDVALDAGSSRYTRTCGSRPALARGSRENAVRSGRGAMNLSYSALIPREPSPEPETLRTAIASDPDNARLHHALGISLLLRQDIEGAKAAIERSLALAPAEPHAYRALGQIHLIRNELDVARSSFEHAIALDPISVDAHAQLAVILILAGETGDALRILSERLRDCGDVPLLWANLGAALLVHGRLEEAIDAYRRALELNPSWNGLRGDLALVLFTRGRFTEAVAERRRMAELEPDSAEQLNDLGTALYAAGELEDAIDVYERAAMLRPEWSVPLENAATAACALNDPQRAATLLLRTIEIAPDPTVAHFDLGMMRMQIGDYTEGLREYEWRWPADGAPLHRPELQVPLWDRTPLAGRSLFLWCEQGRGDMIQFARFVSRIPKDGGRVVLHTVPRLVRLLATVEGVDQVVTHDEGLDADVQFPLFSLPAAFEVTIDDLGETPYLRAPERSEAAESLIPHDGAALNVGCVWAGNPAARQHRQRDCEVHEMADLASLVGVRLFSLQWGERAPDVIPYSDQITDLSEVLGDFATTAAFVERLDLVITVDTAMAHLAGALGKPVWLLLGVPDWRWTEGRSDSAWYPTMRIYRKPREDDWTGVFERVRRDLAGLARARGRTHPPAPPLDRGSLPRTIFVKQYGERRTGTNLLRTLLAQNYHAEVLMHILGDKHSPPVPFDVYWRDAQRDPNPAKAFVCRSTFSAPSLTTTAFSFDQIHELTHCAEAIADAFASGELRYVISIRDPYAWAVSLAWFLEAAARGETVPAECADAMRGACLEFNARYSAWLDLAEHLPSRAVFIRYEELRANPEAVCENLARACGLTRRTRIWRNLERTVLPANWDNDPELQLGPKLDRDSDGSRHLSQECRDAVEATIDWSLIEQIYTLAGAIHPRD